MIWICFLFVPLSAALPLSGWVESPGYPRGYPEEASLNWKRCAPIGHALSLTLTHLDLEDSEGCQSDALQISSDGVTLFTLCGRMSFAELQSTVNPLLLSSTSGCLALSFHSDYSNPKRHSGFRAFYTVRDVDECADPENDCTHFCNNYIGGYRCSCRPGYSLHTDGHTCTVSCTEDLSGSVMGIVQSPGRPGPYPENGHCSYTLSVDETLQLVLQFSEEFDVEDGEGGQCIDSVTIKTPSHDLGSFCGRVPPPTPILTGSHKVQIIFSTDGTGTNTGFILSYRTQEKTCPMQVTPQSHLTPQLPQYRYGDQVTVSCDIGFVLDLATEKKEAINITTYTSSCGKTGIWSPVYNCEVMDCGPPDIPEDGPLQLSDPNTSTQYQDEVQFKCESKYYMLNGEESYTCDAQGKWKSKSGQEKLPKCETVCGKTAKEIARGGRIFGGSMAKRDQIPWQLLIQKVKRGGASLINDQWAITAAHVVDGLDEGSLTIYGGTSLARPAVNIELGKINYETAMKRNRGLAIMETEKIFIHPKYEKGQDIETRLTFDNDIALIKLKSRVELSPTLLPICLPEKTEGSVDGLMGTVSGWGNTENVTFSPDLLYVDVQIYSNYKCSQTPKNEALQKQMSFTENMFCAGGDGKDSCHGDSGGPFVLPMLGSGNKEKKDPYRLYGIVSWGGKCGEGGYYTKVENYLDWIKETMSRDEQTHI